MIAFELLHPAMTAEALGYLPTFFNVSDPRPAREQIDSNYCSGWNPFPGHTFAKDRMALLYSGDPPMMALARAKLRDETLIFYECEWLAIIQADGSHEIARVD